MWADIPATRPYWARLSVPSRGYSARSPAPDPPVPTATGARFRRSAWRARSPGPGPSRPRRGCSSARPHPRVPGVPGHVVRLERTGAGEVPVRGEHRQRGPRDPHRDGPRLPGLGSVALQVPHGAGHARRCGRRRRAPHRRLPDQRETADFEL